MTATIQQECPLLSFLSFLFSFYSSNKGKSVIIISPLGVSRTVVVLVEEQLLTTINNNNKIMFFILLNKKF